MENAIRLDVEILKAYLGQVTLQLLTLQSELDAARARIAELESMLASKQEAHDG